MGDSSIWQQWNGDNKKITLNCRQNIHCRFITRATGTQSVRKWLWTFIHWVKISFSYLSCRGAFNVTAQQRPGSCHPRRLCCIVLMESVCGEQSLLLHTRGKKIIDVWLIWAFEKLKYESENEMQYFNWRWTYKCSIILSCSASQPTQLGFFFCSQSLRTLSEWNEKCVIDGWVTVCFQ